MPRMFCSLIQSDFTHNGHGNLEAVIWTGEQLQHWFRDAGRENQWFPAKVIVPQGVAGAGSIIQSDFTHGEGGDNHGNFEVVVPIRNPSGSVDLWHYFRENFDVTTPWMRAGTQPIVTGLAGPACIIQSDFTHGEGGDKHGNFEVVVPISRGNGWQLRHFFRENADVSTPWQSGQMITDSCSGWACLIHSDFGESWGVGAMPGCGGHRSGRGASTSVLS